MKVFTREAVARGLKTADLAELCGVTEREIYLWKSGQAVPEPIHLEKLAEKLKVEISKLLDNFSALT